MAVAGGDAFSALGSMGSTSGRGRDGDVNSRQEELENLYAAMGRALGQSFLSEMEKKGPFSATYAKAKAEEDARNDRELTKKALELRAKYDHDAEARRKLNQMKFIDGFKEAGQGIVDKLTKGLGTFTKALDKSIDTYTQIYQKYQASINARLQGSMYDFQGLSTTIQGNLALSPYVKQTAVLENLSKLVESGTAYNLEQRAFLASISDKIATTFNSFDSSLMSIIRIQQADSTVARLGMEAQLTQFLNSRYSDTSYLTGAYDTVAGNLLAASSTMSREQSVEFEYQVQKWLGSLGSVGVSTGTLTSLSQMIGALGSGDLSALSGNQSLQNLLAISSAGSYGDLLRGGLSPTNTNKLLYNLVTYLGGIQGNNIVKTQLAKIFGVSRSDIEAIANLSQSDLSNILGTNLTYAGATAETSSQLKNVRKRMHISELIDNVIGNITLSLAGSIANNPVSYSAWMLTDMLEKATGGTNIPTIGAMGNFVDLNATLEQIMKLGIAGVSGLGSGMVGKAIGALAHGGSLNLDNWNAQDTITRGGGMTRVDEGLNVDVSSTQYIGTSSSSDIYKETVTAAKSGASEEIKSNVSESDMVSQTVKDIYSLLTNVVSGVSTFKVKLENYGLTYGGNS